MATFGILVALILAFLIGTVLIWFGVNQILSIGVSVLSLLVGVLGMLGFGRQRVEPTVNPEITVDPDDVQVEIDRGNLKREESSRRVGFPDRTARVLRKLRKFGIEYAYMRYFFAGGTVIGVLIMAPMILSLFTSAAALIDAGLPSFFVTYGQTVEAVLGRLLPIPIALVGMMVTVFSMVGYMILTEAYKEATCGECGEEFCLTFKYATYDPCAREEHTNRVYDNDGNPVGTEVSGYTYRDGTVYATCTTRDELVEIEHKNWYVSMN